MIIKVFPDNRVALEDVQNFRAFKVVIEGSPTKLEDVRLALLDLAELPIMIETTSVPGELRHGLGFRGCVASPARGRTGFRVAGGIDGDDRKGEGLRLG